MIYSDSMPIKRKFYDYIEKNPYTTAFVIIVFFTLLRLWFISTGQLNLSPDEAQYWDWSRDLQLSYYSKGPLIAWNIGFWTFFLGDTEFAIRFAAVFNSVISQLIILFGVSKIFKRPALAVLCLFVANTMPLFSASAILTTTDSPLLICWLVAFFSLYILASNPSSLRLNKESAKEPSSIIIAKNSLTIAIALGVLAKYMMLAFFAPALLFLLILLKNKLISFVHIVYIFKRMIFGCIVGMLPIVLWNALNGWVGFLHVGTLAGVTGKNAQQFFDLPAVPEFLGGQFGIAMPWWLIIALITGYSYLKLSYKGESNSDKVMHSLQKEEAIRQQAMMSSFFMLMITAFFVWSFHTTIYANWPAMSYVGGILLAASGFERMLCGFSGEFFKKHSKKIILGMTSIGIIIYFLVALPIPAKIDPSLRLKGWSDLGNVLAEYQQEFENSEEVFFFSSKYDTTAALAFYGPNQPRSYDANFDNRLAQYDLWPNPSNTDIDMKGWDALYISTKLTRPESYFINNLKQLFEHVEITRYQSKHKFVSGREFIIIKCYNYNGTWVNREINSY